MNHNGKRTILVVEDEPFVQMLLIDYLNELGHNVLAANDASAALRMLQEDAAVDLLLTDVGLPGKNGQELAEEARRLRPELPVLFATGYSENNENLAKPLLPRAAVVGKPFDLQRLAAALQNLLNEP
jgi:CheY-like chemotaxis protein